MSSSDEVPPNNPVLTAYESFAQSTPYITRSILSIQVISYALSWFVDPMYALGNIPVFSVEKFEIYRILLSPLVNNSIISLLFAFISFLPLGKRLEASMGSTAFGWLCLALGVFSNIIFILLSYLQFFLTGNRGALLANSFSIWIILFGIISIECSVAPSAAKRPFFFGTQVPVRYYPLALYLAFGIFSFHFSMAFLISIGLGYLVGLGDSSSSSVAAWCRNLVMLPTPRAQQWEQRYLSKLTSQQGWVSESTCLGSAAWNSENMTANSMNLPLFNSQANGSNDSSESSQRVFGTSGSPPTMGPAPGQTLGGSAGVDARTARLEALERRQQEQRTQNQQNQRHND